MGLFSGQKTTRHDLKKELDELLRTEVGLWQLTSTNGLRRGIPSIIDGMKSIVLELRNDLAEVHLGRTTEFHVNVQQQTPLGKELDTDLQKLEELVQTQMNLLQNISNMSEEQVKEVLNHGKESDISRTSQLIQDLIQKLDGEIEKVKEIPKYELINANTFVKALALLRQRGGKPLTMEENFQLRVDMAKLGDFNLFNNWLDCSYAILYKGDGIHFKLVKEKKLNVLLNLPENFNEVSFKCSNYEDITGVGVYEFSLDDSFNTDLNKEQILSHPFYKILFEGKMKLLEDYVEIYFTKFKRSEAMGIYLIKENKICEWRALCVDDNNSRLLGNSLDDGACFVLRP